MDNVRTRPLNRVRFLCRAMKNLTSRPTIKTPVAVNIWRNMLGYRAQACVVLPQGGLSRVLILVKGRGFPLLWAGERVRGVGYVGVSKGVVASGGEAEEPSS